MRINSKIPTTSLTGELDNLTTGVRINLDFVANRPPQ